MLWFALAADVWGHGPRFNKAYVARTTASGRYAPIQIPGQCPDGARNSLMRCSMPPSNERVVAVVLGPIRPSVQDPAKVPIPTSSGRLFVLFCRRRLAVFHALTIAVYSTASSGYRAQEGRGATSPKATGPYTICSLVPGPANGAGGVSRPGRRLVARPRTASPYSARHRPALQSSRGVAPPGP